jgi:hypothetical protein
MARDLLSSAKVKHAKVGMHADGGGLYLQVTKSKDGKQLNKSWLYVFKSPTTGKRLEMGLGSLDTFGLSEARDAAEAARKIVQAGHDPIDQRDSEPAARRGTVSKSKTFEQCAVAYIAAHEAGWRNAKHRSQWTNTLRDYVYLVFGSLPVDQIDMNEVMKALAPIWTAKPETASRVRSRIELVLDWARVKGYRSGENPARWRGHLDHLLVAPGKARKAVHHSAMPYADASAFMARLRAQECMRQPGCWSFSS